MMAQKSIRWAAALALVCFIFSFSIPVSADNTQAALQGPPAPWQIETVDDGRIIAGLGQHSLAYDSLGYPHVAYGSDHLYHAWWNGSSWTVETVDDSPRVGSHAALALDSQNHVYITYYDETNQDLKYATNWKGWWEIATLASAGNVGIQSRIFADWNGQGPELWVGYLDSSTAGVFIRFAGQDTTGIWDTPELVSGSLPVGSFAMTLWGQPRFSFYASGGIYYGYYGTGAWQHEQIDGPGCSSATDIAVDSSGTPYIPISCYDSVGGWGWITYLAYKDASVWKLPTNPDPSNLILGLGDPYPEKVSIAYRQAENKMYIAMQRAGSDGSHHNLQVVRGLKDIFYVSTWFNLETNFYGELPLAAAVSAVTSHAKAGVVYLSGSSLKYKYLPVAPETWNESLSPVDTTSGRGSCNVLKADSTGRLRVMYYRGDTGVLYYKHTTASGWSSTFTVTDTGEWAACGQYDRPSMDLLADGTPVAAYVTSTRNLVYAKFYCPPVGRCGFNHETVDVGLSPGTGGSTAVAIGNVDNPNILYHKGSHLWLAYKPTPAALTWTIIPVDDALSTYGPLSLETDKDGKLHAAFISQMDYPYYARFGFGGTYWSAITQLENASYTWDPLQVAVNPLTGRPQVAYNLENDLILRSYACPILICSWYSQIVDTPTDSSGVLKEISFVIDSRGKRSFAYYYTSPAQGQNGLKVMQVDGSINTPFLIENGVTVGDTSLVLRPGDVPVVAYFLPQFGELRVARGSSGVFLPLIRR